MTAAAPLIAALATTVAVTLLATAAGLEIGPPPQPIVQPSNATAIARLPSAAPTPTRSPVLFPRLSTPVDWCWVCRDTHACRGALFFTLYCSEPTAEPYTGDPGGRR